MHEYPSLEPDPVIEFYKQSVDMAAIRENLRLTPEQRIQKLMEKLRAEEDRCRAACESKGRAPERAAEGRGGAGYGEDG